MKNLKNSKKTSGISLVALIVTIIVLIILTAAVIVTFMEGGIIEKAKEAVFKSDIRTYQEILAVKNAEKQIELATGNGEGGLYNETEYDKIKEIIPEFKEEYKNLIAISNGEIVLGSRTEDPYSTWLADLGIGSVKLLENVIANKVKVGDYVAYIPEGNNTTNYELKYEDSGYVDEENSEPKDQTITRQNINWRVLKIDEKTNQVTLISEEPVINIGLTGEAACKNGIRLLDDVYSTLYKSNKTVEVRNLKVEDVNEIMGVILGENVQNRYDHVYPGDNGEYREIPFGTTVGDLIDEYGYNVTNMSIDEILDYEIIDYTYSGNTFKTDENSIEHSLIFSETDGMPYWLSSKSYSISLAEQNWSESHLGLFTISNDKLYGFGMLGLHNVEDAWMNCAFEGRPIVILKADVEISGNNTGNGSSADSAWRLK